MKIVLLTNCIFREKVLEEQLHLLGHEVFISEHLLTEPLAMVRFFDMVILSDTMPKAQQLDIVKRLGQSEVPMVKVSQEEPVSFTDGFADVIARSCEIEELGNKLATIKKVHQAAQSAHPKLQAKQNKKQDLSKYLSKMENRLLEFLKEARGEIVTKEEISIFLWEGELTTSRQSHISGMVKRIRKKMELYQPAQFEIITVWRKGYYVEAVNGWQGLEAASKEELLQQPAI